MVVKRAILILSLILAFNTIYSQYFLDTLTYSVDSALIDLKVDKLNNKWFIYENSIIRVSTERAYNDTLDNLNLKQLSLDLNTPLKNLFYYRNKNSIEIKNSRWGIISNFRLDILQIYQPSFVKFAVDKMIWILDISENTLFKLNENGVKIAQKRNPFKVKKTYYFPSDIVFVNNNCVALDTSYGVFILDDYGNLIQSIKIDSCKKIFEHKGALYLTKSENTLVQFGSKPNGDIDLNNQRTVKFNSEIESLCTYNENTLILLQNKRIYEMKKIEALFQ